MSVSGVPTTARRRAGRRRLPGAAFAVVGLALLFPGCVALNLGSSPEPAPAAMAIPPGAYKYHALLMQAWQYHFQFREPEVGFAQVHQESRFDCTAVSRQGSLGCAQFMPMTAKWINDIIPAAIRATCPSSSGCPMDPRWALTALVEYDFLLWQRGAWAANRRERWAFTLASYNGGTAVTGAERKACSASQGCNPTRYFDHVERFCGAAGRSAAACGENRNYPRTILDRWAPMYKTWLSR